jgi:predicted anti-sigma-YlaC factor YlaD
VRVADPARLQAIYSRRFSKQSIDAQLEWEHLEGLRGHYKHKGRWSWFLMAVMAFMIGFQSYLLYKVGTKAWDFTSYDWLLPVLLAQNLAQIVGLAVFVVKALFKDLKKP